MTILAFEFSSLQRSVAVLDATEASASSLPQVIPAPRDKCPPAIRPSQRFAEVVEAGRGNIMKPLGMVAEALLQAGLEREQIGCLVVGLGPGSYTGIRAAIALAQGWQLGRGTKLLGVSSAACAAAQAQADGLRGKASVVIDAQRGEFYLAGYELNADSWRETAPLRLATLTEVREREQAGETLIGPEVARWFPSGKMVFPRAAMLGKLALDCTDFIAGEKLEPIYLRETKFVKAPAPRIFNHR